MYAIRSYYERIGGWLVDPEPTHVRNSSIFFDFLPLEGTLELAHDLREIVVEAVKDHPGFLYHMMTLDLRYKVPLSLLRITSYNVCYTKLLRSHLEEALVDGGVWLERIHGVRANASSRNNFV